IGNYIGLSVDGTKPLGNAHDGVAVLDGATGTHIGEVQQRYLPYYNLTEIRTASVSSLYPPYYYGSQGNTIGGNGRHCIFVDGSSPVSKTLIAGNTIGGVGYNYPGAVFLTASNSTTTTSTASDATVTIDTVSLGNVGDGIYLGTGATDTTVNGNSI